MGLLVALYALFPLALIFPCGFCSLDRAVFGDGFHLEVRELVVHGVTVDMLHILAFDPFARLLHNDLSRFPAGVALPLRRCFVILGLGCCSSGFLRHCLAPIVRSYLI